MQKNVAFDGVRSDRVSNTLMDVSWQDEMLSEEETSRRHGPLGMLITGRNVNVDGKGMAALRGAFDGWKRAKAEPG
jgi:hypothetical protein